MRIDLSSAISTADMGILHMELGLPVPCTADLARFSFCNSKSD